MKHIILIFASFMILVSSCKDDTTIVTGRIQIDVTLEAPRSNPGNVNYTINFLDINGNAVKLYNLNWDKTITYNKLSLKSGDIIYGIYSIEVILTYTSLGEETCRYSEKFNLQVLPEKVSLVSIKY